jgi:uncharacterized protein YjdB
MDRRSAVLILAAPLMLLTWVLGCGGSKSGGGEAMPPPSVSITASSASITIGQSDVLTISTSNAASCVGSGSLSGSVTCNGTVTVTPTATGVLQYIVTATGNGGSTSASASVTINPVPATITSITVTATPASITTAQTATCSASVLGTGAFSSSVTWTATGGTITTGGVFTPSGAGSGSCIATSTQAGYTTIFGSATITATVPPLTIKTIAISGTTSLIVGQSQPLTAIAFYSDGSTSYVTSSAAWASSTPAVATVSSSGTVAGLGPGQSMVTATFGGISGSVNIIVSAKALTSIQLSPVSATLAIGLSQQLTALGTYNDGSTSTLSSGVTWSSSVPSFATVASSGVVTTVAQGTTTITANSGGIQGSVVLSVLNTTGGPVLINDLTDSRILTAANADQSILTFFGTRDSNGNPLSIYEAKRVASDGTWQTLSIDSQGRPTAVTLSDSTQFLLKWTSSTGAIITGITADGKNQVAFPIGSAAKDSLALVRSGNNLPSPQERAEPKDTSNPASSLVTVNVTSCGVPESYAQAFMVSSNGTTDLAAVNGSPGTYQGSVGAGPPNSGSTKLQLSTAFGPVCEYVDAFETSLNSNGATLQGVICAGAIAAALLDPLAAPLATTACATSGEGLEILNQAVALACTVATGSLPDSIIALLTYPAEISVYANVPGGDTSPLVNVLETSAFGGYPVTNIALSCPKVDHVTITPSTATLNIGQAVDLVAGAYTSPPSELIRSSAFTFAWNPLPIQGIATTAYVGSASAESFVTVTGTNPGGPLGITVTELSSSQQGTSNITVTPISITLSPTSGSVSLGSTEQFTATVAGTTNTVVTWSVNGVDGGNSTVGTISSTGLYTAPSTLPGPGTVAVTATSQADSTVSASATVTITPPTITLSPTIASVALSGTQQFTAAVSGATNTSVTWSVNGVDGGNSTVGTVSSAGLYTAPSTLPNPATVAVAATSQAASTVSASATVTVTPPTITLSPTSASVALSSTLQFKATVSGATNTSVTWSVNGVNGGNSTVGTVSSAGLYTAPSTLPNPVTVTVTATSQADSMVSASASATITIPPALCNPLAITFYAPGQTCTSWWQPDGTGMPASLSFQISNPGVVSVQGSPVTLPSNYSGAYPPAQQYIGTFVAGSASGTSTVQVLATHPDGSSQYYNTWSIKNAF